MLGKLLAEVCSVEIGAGRSSLRVGLLLIHFAKLIFIFNIGERCRSVVFTVLLLLDSLAVEFLFPDDVVLSSLNNGLPGDGLKFPCKIFLKFFLSCAGFFVEMS